MDAPATTGLLHAGTVHAVLCRTCARQFGPRERRPRCFCPVCKQLIEAVVAVF